VISAKAEVDGRKVAVAVPLAGPLAALRPRWKKAGPDRPAGPGLSR
jgi:hypothetical protein